MLAVYLQTISFLGGVINLVNCSSGNYIFMCFIVFNHAVNSMGSWLTKLYHTYMVSISYSSSSVE